MPNPKMEHGRSDWEYGMAHQEAGRTVKQRNLSFSGELAGLPAKPLKLLEKRRRAAVANETGCFSWFRALTKNAEAPAVCVVCCVEKMYIHLMMGDSSEGRVLGVVQAQAERRLQSL